MHQAAALQGQVPACLHLQGPIAVRVHPHAVFGLTGSTGAAAVVFHPADLRPAVRIHHPVAAGKRRHSCVQVDLAHPVLAHNPPRLHMVPGDAGSAPNGADVQSVHILLHRGKPVVQTVHPAHDPVHALFYGREPAVQPLYCGLHALYRDAQLGHALLGLFHANRQRAGKDPAQMVQLCPVEVFLPQVRQRVPQLLQQQVQVPRDGFKLLFRTLFSL